MAAKKKKKSRNDVLFIRLHPAERAYVEVVAERRGVTVAVLVREALRADSCLAPLAYGERP